MAERPGGEPALLKLPGNRAEMRPRSGAFWVALWLWVLWTLGVASDSRGTVPRRCLLSHYRFLDPRALAAVKALRDSYEEETLSWRPRNCSFRLQLIPQGSRRKSPRPPRRHHKPRRADSPGCHEASVIFNLLRLLTRDLRLVAHSGPCV
ncbi:interferon lambda-4-like [Ictidomys tridecemlineatus]|uniref:interferon lambda-4-like n=1 Tax=Ictidomys tridecemlineatus TaxID=43179 RepID=UPI00038BC0EC|nr:interferon lambda-4-like [Ictidomys tridecemlineatus]KAG3256011.1 interferon lambda-4-like [Ictidomys tridecemlineatus]